MRASKDNHGPILLHAGQAHPEHYLYMREFPTNIYKFMDLLAKVELHFAQ